MCSGQPKSSASQPPHPDRPSGTGRLVAAAALVITLALALRLFAPDLRVLELAPNGTNQHWRLRWNTVPGLDYQVQRAKDDQLVSVMSNAWLPLLSLRATGTTATAEDPAGPLVRQRFYRIVQLTNGPLDTQPPAIAFSSARIVADSSGVPQLRLTYQATDNVAVASVTIREGTNLLGTASSQGGSEWVFQTGTLLDLHQVRQFTAVARDLAGQTNATPPAAVRSADPEFFVGLDAQGVLREGQPLLGQGSNSISAFTFRPGGRDLLGYGQGLVLRFPAGAELIEELGQTYLRFTEVSAEFGPASILQFARPLQRTGGSARQIPVGALSLATLAEVFDLDPAEGIPLLLFGRFPLLARGGVVEAAGVREAKLSFAPLGLPLPELSGEFSGQRIEFNDTAGLRLPLTGEFTLPNGPTLRAEATRPLWLTLNPDGQISLAGRVEIVFPDGISFFADVRLEDPNYELRLALPGSEAGALEVLAGQLDQLPGGCLPSPSSTNAPALDLATRCLEAHAAAYLHFHLALESLRGPGEAERSRQKLPPATEAIEHALLQAWGDFTLPPLSRPLSLDSLEPTLRQLARSAPSGQDLPGLLASRLALLRLRQARLTGALGGSLQTEQTLGEAMHALDAAAARLCDSTLETPTPLVLAQATALVRESETARLAANEPAGDFLNRAFPDWVRRGLRNSAQALGISPGQFSSSSNLAVRTLNARSATALFTHLLEAQQQALALGLNLSGLPVGETLGQLGLRIFDDTTNQLARAEAQADYPAFLSALQDLTTLIEARGRPGFPSPPALPGPADWPALIARLQNVLEADSTRAEGSRTLANRGEELAQLLRVLRGSTNTPPPSPALLQRTAQETEAQLAAALSVLDTTTSLPALLDLLRTGSAHAEFIRRLGLVVGADWEGTRLPLVVSRIQTLAQIQQAWPDLHAAAASLLESADFQARLQDSPRRRLYLVQAAPLLTLEGNLGVTTFTERQGLLDAPGALALPGNLFVENIAGSARFNRVNGRFAGDFSGTLRVPDLNATLTINTASFDGTGAFEMAVSGQFLVPPAAPVLTVTVPSARPLRFRYTPEDGVGVSGSANFQFNNGAFFTGDISLLDPVYSFNFTAGGLEFALASALAGQVPNFPGGNSFSSTNLDLWTSYYENLGASLAPANAAANVVHSTLTRAKAGGDEALPPVSFASLEAYADWIELQDLLAGNPQPGLSREALTDMMVQYSRQVFKEAEEQARMEDAEPPVTPLAGAAKHAQAKSEPFVPRVLQFDFGPPALPYTGDGPGQAEERINPAHLTWNLVSADLAGGLKFADGTDAPGISLDLGRRRSSDGVLEFGFAPVAFANPANGTLGMFDNNLFRDGLTTFNLANLQPSALAVRVSGLAPGFFLAYGLVMDTPLVVPIPENRISAGRIRGSLITIDEPQPLISPDVPISGWNPGLNYIREGVNLEEEADSLLVLSGVLVGGGEIGKLQGLQLVETRPLITTLSVQPAFVDAGRMVELKWNTRFSTRNEISAGIGEVPKSGSRKFPAVRTTRFTLTSSNASGATERSVTLVVDGPKRQVAALAEGLARMTRTYRRVSTHLDHVADRNLHGFDDYVDLGRVQRELDRARDTFRSLANNPAATKDLKTFQNVARAGFNLGVNYQTTGLDDPVTPGEAVQFVEKGKRDFEIRFGANPQTGEPDLAVVNAKSADESIEIVKVLIDLGGLALETGSTNGVNGPLTQAHLANARQKILAGLGFNPANNQIEISELLEADAVSAANKLILVDEQSDLLLNPVFTPGPVFLQLGDRIQAAALENLGRIPATEWTRRFLSLQNLRHGNTVRLRSAQPGLTPAFVAKIRAELLLEARQLQASAGAGARLGGTEVEFLAFALDFLPDPELNTLFAARVEQALTGLQTKVNEPWTTERLPEGPVLLEELVTLHDLLGKFQQKGGTHAINAALLAPAQVPVLTTQFTAAAGPDASEAMGKFTRALTAAQKRLGTGNALAGRAKDGDPLVSVLQQQAHSSTRHHALILSNTVARFLIATNSFAPVDLGLPESLRVSRVFGSILYNRETGLLQGGFGGRLEFPDVNAFFEIRNATVDNQGNFTIEAATETPLPFNGTRLAAELVASHTNQQLFVRGSGQLLVPSGTSTQTFAATLTYDSSNHRLAFDTSAQNLNWVLADDFVLFDAGLGFDLSTGSPNGSFRVSGSAGLFAREHPLPASVTRSNFNLVVDGLTTVFTYSTNTFALNLSNGLVRLPDFFHNGLCDTNGGAGNTGPQIALVPGSPVGVTIRSGPSSSAAFQGALDFRQLGFTVPGLTNLGVEVCSARLLFRSNALPCFSNLQATLSIPLPNQTALLDLTGVEWCVDGFPTSATIGLRQQLRLFDAGGVAFDVLTNSTFGFSHLVTNGQDRTTFQISGGVQGTFDDDLLTDAQTSFAFRFGTTGSFFWQTDQSPQFALGDLNFAGRLKLGGNAGFELRRVDANGIPTTNANSLASVTLSGLSNLFNLSPDHPFEVRVNGALGSQDFLFFGLGDAKFRFDGQPPEPQFSVASLGFSEGNSLKLLGQSLLPFRVTAGSIAFRNPNLALNRLFEATNLNFNFSGLVDISLGPPDSDNPTTPRLFGALQNVGVSLPGGFAAPPQFSVNTFALTLENLTIGDMAGLSGGLAVGNLNNPSELFFAGLVGGTYNGFGLKAIVATRLDGLLGLCLSVNAGPAGIPLDGGALGGILLTGAEGGVSFLNQFADPCDFKSFLGLDASGAPPALLPGAKRGLVSPKVSGLEVLSWAELERFQKLHLRNKSLRQAGLAKAFPVPPASVADSRAKDGPADVPCPTGDCPPATLNLLCQRHPSVGENPSAENYNGLYADRTIFKFSSLDRATVDDVLAAANLNLNGSASVVAGNFANAVTNLLLGLLPRPPASLPAAQRQEINDFIDSSLAAMRGLLATASQAALEAAAGQGRTPLEALYEVAYAGVKCVDVTIQLKGTFSYAPVSVALNAQGGAVASTTGSAGILGTVNLFGLPVGTGEFFYSLTDTNGNPNPSLCGNARVALGPLEMGHLGLAIGCDECVTGTLLALQNFIISLTGQVLNDVSPLLYTFIESAASNRLGNIRSIPLSQFFGPPGPNVRLNQSEQIAVLGALLNLPKLHQFIRENPGAFTTFGEQAVATLAEQSLQLVLNLYNSVNPRLQFCGEAEPKIFGFSLTGGNTLAAARAYADKTNLRGDVTFSPSYIFGNLPFFLLSGGAVNNIVPALDEATMGMSVGLPVINNQTLHLLATNPVQFAAGQFDNLLANATITFGYELSPFGFKLADGEGRIALPTLFDHPDNPLRRNAHPAQYNASGQYLPPSFPDRSAILKAALDSNRLAQATWSGKGTDLSALFPAGSAEAGALTGRELVRDYFPYGGFLGASKVQLPKPITDAPPLDQLAKLFAPPTNLLEQLQIAQEVFNTYITGSREVGELMIHLPFPRPPTNFWLAGQGSQALIDSITQPDLNSLLGNLSLLPTEQFFMRGGINAQFLGLPIGAGELVADPAQGVFRLNAGVPAGSWMKSFFDASLSFETKRADYIAASAPQGGPGTNHALAPETRLQEALNQLLAAASGSTAQKQAAISNAVVRITDTLPKASLDLSLNNFGVPESLTNILTASAAAHFYAYSPRFEPGFVGTGPVAEARRNGGVAFKGRFNFASYVEIENAELGVALRPAGLPALSGLFDVPTLGVPGLALHNAHFAFNSAPAINGSFIEASGTVDPITLVNPLNSGQVLLTIRNLTNSSSPLSAEFDLLNPANGPPLPGFAISPSRIDMPMLGPDLSTRIHGATTNDPFSFSSTGPWGASVSLVGQLGVRDLGGNEVLRFGAVGQPFSASLLATGLNLGRLEIILPTNLTLIAFPDTTNAQSFTLGSGGVTNRLLISGDGTFSLDGGIAGSLPLNGLGFGSISAGATIHVDNTQMRVTINGNLTGGALDSLAGHASISSLSGTFLATRNGVSLSGLATISPMTFGAFRLSGASGGNITAVATNFGFAISSGARLRILAPGYPTNDLFTLNAFGIAGNGDFNISAQNGSLNIPGYFLVTTGAFTFLRSNTVASLDMFAPTVQLFPGKPFATTFTPPLQHVFIESTARFYADSGNQTFNLPGAFVARGRLEFGYEPDVHQPGLGVPAGLLNFGTVTYGFTSNRVLNLTNTGSAPLSVDLAGSPAGVFSVTPAALNLDPGEVAAVSVRFNPPPRPGPTNGLLTLLHNAPGGFTSLAMTGSVRSLPVLALSSPAFDLGDGKLNQIIRRGLRVDNLGLTNLLLTNRILSGPFTVTPTNVTVLPGSNVVLEVTFSPTAVAGFNGSLEIRNNDSAGTRNVPLSGSGSVLRWVDTRNRGEQFRALATSGGSNALAITTNRLFYTDTRGHSWSQPASNVFPGLRAVAMAANSPLGWLCGDGKLALETPDGGKNWQTIPGLSGNEWRVAIEQPGLNRVVFGGKDILTGRPSVAIERAAGFDLRPVTTNGISFSLSGLAWQNVGSQTIALAQDVSGRVHRSVNAGSNWVNVASFGQQSDGPGTIALNTSGFALAVAYTKFVTIDFQSRYVGSVYRSADAGATWTRVLNLSNVLFTSVSLDGSVGYLAGRTFGGPGQPVQGLVLRSGDSGATWFEEEVEAPPLYAVSARLGEVLVAGDAGDIQRRPAAPPTRGVLEFDPGALNFGFVPFGDSAPRALTFYNAGISNLTITNVVLQGAQAGQFAIGAGTFPKTLAPGASDSINLFCNPTNAGILNASLRINANDPEGFFSVPLTARSSTSGWVLKAPLTNSLGFTVLDVQMLDALTGYALNSRDLYKTTDGGVTWRLANSPAGTFSSMHWIDANQGFLAGGTLAIPLISAGDSFIFRTVNGGTNWTRVYSDTDQPVNNLSVLSGGTGYAVTVENFRVFGDSGSVLKTTNSGVNWFAVTTPTSAFSGRALVVNSTLEVFAGSGSVLHRTADGGATWAPVTTNGTASLRSLDFASTSTIGLAVGNGGAFRRTASGGDTPAEWSSGTPFTTNDLNSVHMVGFTVTWAVPASTAPEAQIFRSDDNGSTWREELSESPYAGPTNLRPTVVFGRSTFTGSLALGTDGSVRRFEDFTNELEGIAVTQPRLDFGQSVEGTPRFTNFILRNLGDRVLNVSNLLVNGLPGFNDDFRATNAVPFSIPVNGSATIGVIASNQIPGTNLARLGIVSDGALVSLGVELRSLVRPRPVVLSFATDPPGLALQIDGTNRTAPAAFTVRLEPGGDGDWDLGSLHAISAPETQSANGLTFTFAGWLPFEERTFTNAVTNVSVAYVASYLASEVATPPAPLFSASKAAKAGPPPGLPTGPYLRLTQASISNAVLGDFSVQGSVLLSADLIEATLGSENFRLPAATNQPPLLIVGAGSWRFSLSNQAVQLRAQSPLVKVMTSIITPPSLFSLDLNLSNTSFRSSFVLPDGAKVAPGLLEFGPGSALLTHTSTFVGLSLTGQVRALRKPDSNHDWAFKQNLSLSFRDGPFTNTIPFSGVLLQIPVPGAGENFLVARATNSARLELRRASTGDFSLFLTNLAVDVLGQNFSTFSGLASTAGQLSLSAGAPASPFRLGNFRWHASGSSSFNWNLRNGALSFTLGGGTLRDDGSGSVPGWPAGGLAMPGFTFDSRGDFEHTIMMPSSFTFFGMQLGQASDTDNRYVRFKRLNGVLSVKLRDRVDFFDSTVKVGFDLNSNGNASGFFDGSFGVDFGGLLGYVPFGNVEASFDSSEPNYQFRQKVRVAGNDFRVKFGSAGAQVCHLYCDDDGCSETLCLGF